MQWFEPLNCEINFNTARGAWEKRTKVFLKSFSTKSFHFLLFLRPLLRKTSWNLEKWCYLPFSFSMEIIFHTTLKLHGKLRRCLKSLSWLVYWEAQKFTWCHCQTSPRCWCRASFRGVCVKNKMNVEEILKD